MLRRAFLGIIALGSLVSACSDSTNTKPPPNDPCVRVPDELPARKPHTPRWAFEPWISKDISDGPDTYAFVKGFRDRDIPVGVVVLDSPWETHYNTFIPNPARYPNFKTMVDDLHKDDIRIVLWITNFVNSISYDFEMGGDAYTGPSPNLEEGEKCNYFVDDGARYSWWKGSGAAVDFFNPSATSWWHEQQNTVLDAGIDGWKLDFGDSYVRTDMVTTSKGVVPHQEYSEAYYRDYLSYGIKRRGNDFLTMVRAWDESYDFQGRFFARKEDAPVAWMGDNRRDWGGLSDALDHVFRSAAAGYAGLVAYQRHEESLPAAERAAAVAGGGRAPDCIPIFPAGLAMGSKSITNHVYSTTNRSLLASLPLQRSFTKVSNRLRKSSGVAGEPPCNRACLMSSLLTPIFSSPDSASCTALTKFGVLA